MKVAFKIFALFVIMLASSCKKDIEEKQQKIILLTKPSGWLILKSEEKQANGSWLDITANRNPFDVDNLLIFDPWLNWAVNEGALKLPGSPQIPFLGTWSFIDNETKIQLDNGTIMEIMVLTETSFQTMVTTNGTINRFTYKHP